uniref:Uncharacterized protein n=1 Tax=Rhizophora mucronata TaxID=61149 RepID=A0A2P2N1E3_RHIMU
MGSVMLFRESGLCMEGPVVLQGAQQRASGQLKRMRFCARLFNVSRERIGKKSLSVSRIGLMYNAYIDGRRS